MKRLKEKTMTNDITTFEDLYSILLEEDLEILTKENLAHILNIFRNESFEPLYGQLYLDSMNLNLEHIEIEWNTHEIFFSGKDYKFRLGFTSSMFIFLTMKRKNEFSLLFKLGRENRFLVKIA